MDLNDICDHCGNSLGLHRGTDDACPINNGDGTRSYPATTWMTFQEGGGDFFTMSRQQAATIQEALVALEGKVGLTGPEVSMRSLLTDWLNKPRDEHVR